MKIALQLSGRLRFTIESIESLIKNIINDNEVDIFCSFWIPENIKSITYLKSMINCKIIDLDHHTVVKPYLNNIFNDLNLYENLPSMLYKFDKISSIRQQYELFTNTSYNCVIQARTDNIFFEKLSIPTDLKGIYCANRAINQNIDNYVSPRLCDNFYLGDSKSVNHLNSAFWLLKSFAEKKLYYKFYSR